jgi:DNA adenine methylase
MLWSGRGRVLRDHEDRKGRHFAVTKAIARARKIISEYERDSVSKTIWGSPAGKKRLANRLAAMLPSHKTYVEPFAGSAAVLFAKERSEVEVINDADPDIVQAYRIIQRLGREGLSRLSRMKWVGDETTFKRLIKAKPKGDVAKPSPNPTK